MPRHFNRDNSPTGSEFDVAIVGGGLSGLVATMRLIEADPNLRLVIVEKEDYLGGQLLTAKEGELGGKWVSVDDQPEVSLSATPNFLMKFLPFSPTNYVCRSHATIVGTRPAGAATSRDDESAQCWPLEYAEAVPSEEPLQFG